MKILFCTQLQLETICSDINDISLAHKWHEMRREKLVEVIDEVYDGCSHAVFAGEVFGSEHVGESTINNFFDIINNYSQIKFILFLDEKEYIRVSYRDDVPDNLFVICNNSDEKFVDSELTATASMNVISMNINNENFIEISKNNDDTFDIFGVEDNNTVTLPLFESTGYDDIDKDVDFGYAVLDFDDENKKDFNIIDYSKFAFKGIELTISKKNRQDDIIKYLVSKLSEDGYETFVRIKLIGKVDFNSKIDIDAIMNELNKNVFSAEVYDNTIFDIDENALLNDISLNNEFIRTTLNDNNLSDSQKSSIIAFGYEAFRREEAELV